MARPRLGPCVGRGRVSTAEAGAGRGRAWAGGGRGCGGSSFLIRGGGSFLTRGGGHDGGWGWGGWGTFFCWRNLSSLATASARTCCFMVSASSSLGRLAGNKNSSEASLRGGDFLLLAMAPGGAWWRAGGRLRVRVTGSSPLLHTRTLAHMSRVTWPGAGGEGRRQWLQSVLC